jgi:hypothetical protein
VPFSLLRYQEDRSRQLVEQPGSDGLFSNGITKDEEIEPGDIINVFGGGGGGGGGGRGGGRGGRRGGGRGGGGGRRQSLFTSFAEPLVKPDAGENRGTKMMVDASKWLLLAMPWLFFN